MGVAVGGAAGVVIVEVFVAAGGGFGVGAALGIVVVAFTRLSATTAADATGWEVDEDDAPPPTLVSGGGICCAVVALLVGTDIAVGYAVVVV